MTRKKIEESLQLQNEKLKRNLDKKSDLLKRMKHDLEIESSLEQMRAAAMSMRRSEDVIIVCEAMYKELTVLGFTNIRNAQVAIKNDAQQSYLISVYSSDEALVMQEAPYKSSPMVEELYNELGTSNNAFFQKEFSGKKFDDWRKWREGLSEFTDSREAEATSMCFYLYSIGMGHLGISTFNAITNEQVEILKRFKNVFELSYTRYIDVAQAEAQAREAQVELALERVRARTMAMQKSDELAETASVLFKQLVDLGIKTTQMRTCAIVTLKPEEPVGECWITKPDGEIISQSFMVPYDETSAYKTIYAAWKNGEKFLVVHLSGDALVQHLNFLKKYANIPTQQFQAFPDQPKETFTHAMFFPQGYLFIISNEPLPGYHDIFKRFGAIFQQTYTRFLDLKNAEAQTRESQIQLALERVRARTMAMQKSDELSETAVLLFHQLMSLGLDLKGCGFNIWEKDEKVCTAWMSGPEGTLSPPFNLPLTEDPLFIRYYESRQNGEDFWVYETGREELVARYEYMQTLPVLGELLTMGKEDSEIDIPSFVVDHVVNFSNGNLIFITYKTCPEAWDIFKRFGKVFEQTYTRFLDLQKAETQTREAKIQLALERVRARTMAMQNSNELPEAANLLFQQAQSLGMPAWSAGYCIWDEDKKAITLWMSSEGVLQPPFRAPLSEDPSFIHFREAHERGETFFVDEIGSEELVKHYKYMRTLPVVGEILDSIIETGHPLPTFQIFHLAFFSQGFLLFITYEPVPEAHDIFKRFAKVFEQTYTRFLDLQRAEAQARESQIQLALERVRARTMAMQKSEELAETSFVLFQQFKDLGETSEQISIGIFNEDGHVMELYSTLYGTQWKDVVKVDLDEPVVMKKIHAAWKEQTRLPDGQEKSLLIDITGDDLREYNAYRKKLSNLEYRDDRWVIHIAFFSKGVLTFSTTDPQPHETIRLLERFAGVFDGTYTRFLDLQKAEAQAREAQIELGLERVRARAMAMQHSDELKELIGTVYNELTKLDLAFDRCLIWVMNREDLSSRLWMANVESQPVNFYMPHHDNPPYLAFVKAWKDRNIKWQYDLHGQVKKEWDGFVFNQTEMKQLPDPVKKSMQAADRVMLAASFHNFGCLQTAGPEPLKEEQFDILNRFAKVFDLTYTRFNDLKQAEAQAREAQIELGLERVRARAMAMQNSSELSQLVDTVFKELTKLDFALTWCIINIIDESSLSNTVWAANPDINKAPESYHMLFEDYPFHHAMMKGWKERKIKDVYILEGQEKKIYDEYLFIETEFKRTPEAAQAASRAMEKYVVSFSFSNFGGLQTVGDAPLSDANLDILSRFGKVFDLTYTRFNDLKQAEAQARESQIQLALERVRARTMAMQKSDELKYAAALLFQQAKALGVPAYSCGYNIWEKGEKEFTSWMSSQDGSDINGVPNIPLTEDANFIRYVDSKQKGEPFFVLELRGERMQEHYAYLKTIPAFKTYFDYAVSVGFDLPETQIHHLANFSQGNLLFITLEPCPEFHDVFKRFAAVFEQTYTRFLDLQKAEAQVRESQIEAALERVRSRSMGMQKSEELKEVIQVVYEQFVHLNIKIEHTGFVIDYKARDDYDIWIADPLGVPSQVTVPYFDSVYYNRFNEAKEKGEDFFATNLDFEEKNRFYQKLFEYVPGLPEEAKGFYFSCPGLAASTVLLDNVCLYIENFSGTPYSDEENNTLMRFGKVFQQTYTRFLDLQKAEAQALEAVKRASVDRVRAEIASMRATNDLERITPLIWNELTVLGIPFIRCGVFIMDEEQQQVQTFLYTEGKTIASFTSTFSNSKLITEALPYWRRKEIFKTHWDEAAFLEQAKSLVKQGAITTGEKYLTEHRPTDLYLHFLPFLQGMLYVGDAASLSDEHLQLVQALADAFSTAYARYEDFNKLEAAKQQVDKTLLDLKQTQTQLIQSEKMASLGELTAGIAHEIQNPLNFVNNFSEVNKELLAELKDEIQKGNIDEVNAIADDVIGNEEKINHHGKRADAIVKGMLQHSRTSTGVKEPTDINALADEYLRLAYHGLRAKDKSLSAGQAGFNATMKTDFDESIGKINIIPQDIGRALLNLITNAFYAVQQKQKETAGKEEAPFEKGYPLYEPSVSVITKRLGDQVSISIGDNGNGIPQNIVEKIFQPFFTTKPTGQGTGLGLSLSYDIVKAHGGEIKVETREREGSNFIIQLPVV